MKISINFNQNNKVTVPKNTTVSQLIKNIYGDKSKDILAALVNNKLVHLDTHLITDSNVKPITLADLDGLRVYQRTAIFILIKALNNISTKLHANILHTLSNGLYLKIDGIDNIDYQFVDNLEKEMNKIINADLPITKTKSKKSEAARSLESFGQKTQARLIANNIKDRITLYHLDGFKSFFIGVLSPSTGYVKKFKLLFHADGLVLHLPQMGSQELDTREIKFSNLAIALKESQKWRTILDLEDVGMFNFLVDKGRHQDFILLAEILHEKRIAQIADKITKDKRRKIVFLAGPSASGKTTFTKRLSMQLRVNGLRPILISMDDYFMDRTKTPKLPNGDYDFESPYALDVELFLKNLKSLIHNEPTILPSFNFKTGTSSQNGEAITPEEKTIFLIEGIHALNPLFSKSLEQDRIFKIYISPLAELPLDSHNIVQNSDTRLLRRILRDHQFRNYSAVNTLSRWPEVRNGETKYIIPFQEDADVYFNTALLYEFSAIRGKVEPLLDEITPDQTSYPEALRLKAFLSFFSPIDLDKIPSHSILREFIGGSFFG